MGESLVKDDVLGICVINIISSVPNAEGIDKVMATEGFDANNVDIKLIVNGIEFDAKKTLEEIWAIREEDVTRRAKELFDDRTDAIINEAHNLAQRMKDMCPWSDE